MLSFCCNVKVVVSAPSFSVLCRGFQASIPKILSTLSLPLPIPTFVPSTSHPAVMLSVLCFMMYICHLIAVLLAHYVPRILENFAWVHFRVGYCYFAWEEKVTCTDFPAIHLEEILGCNYFVLT